MRRKGTDMVVVFADLAGFTAFTEAHGDLAAMRAAARFALRAMQVGRRAGLRPIKTLGDGVLMIGDEPRAALRAARRLTEMFDGSDGSPAAHVGIHSGEVIEQDGDVFGRAVNLAAKLAAAAPPAQVLVTHQLASAAAELNDCEVEALGERQVNGLPNPIPLYAIHCDHGSAA